LASYTTTSGINSQLGNYTTTSAINSQLGNYTNTVDLNSQLASYTNTNDLNERLSALEQRLAALESGGTIESIMTSDPILTQVGNTYTIEVVGDNLGGGWNYKVNATSFKFTKDAVLTISFETTKSVTVIVQGTSGDEFTSSIDLVYQIESIMTSEPILTQVDNTYTIEAVGDNLGSEGWYYSINNTAFNFTTDTIQTRSFTTDQTVTVTVQGTGGDEFTSSIVLDFVTPAYKYLGFAGQSGSTHGWLNEIALTLTDGTKIDKNNQIPINMITLVANIRPGLPQGVGNNINGIFDGQLANTGQNALMFEAQQSGILLYMEATDKKQVDSGVYFTQGDNISYQIDAGRLYGTDTDPNTFTYAQNDANWNYICDLTKVPITVQSPYYSYATVIAKGNANTTIDLNDFKINVLTINGRINGYPSTGGEINIEGYESVTRSTEPGLLIDGLDNGYTWTDTSINTNNTLFTFSIAGILEVDGLTLQGALVPEDLFLMLLNLHDNPTKEEIENENHNVKYVYSDTTMFDGETEHFTYTRIVQSPAVEPVERLVATGGNWEGTYDYLYMETTPEGQFLYGLGNKSGSSANSGSGWNAFYIKYDPNDGKFYDVGSSDPITWSTDANGTNLSAFPTAANIQTLYWYQSDDVLVFVFTNPYYVAPPVDEPDESFKRLVATGGNWQGSFDYYYFGTTSEGRYLYGLVNQGSTVRLNGDDQYDIEYDPSDGKWYDVGSNTPTTWGIDETGTNLSSFPTNPNMPIQYWYYSDGTFKFQFDNPYYVAPPVDAPDESHKRFVPTAGNWKANY